MKAKQATGNAIILLAALGSLTGDAAAQPLVRSFAELQPTLRVGQNLIVKGDDGTELRGRFVSLSADRLEIRRTRWFFREERRVFAQDSVFLIEDNDSDWNGVLLGLGAGIFMAWIAVADCDEDACVTFLLAPVVGPIIGSQIDKAHNRPLYLSPRGNVIALAPLLGPRQLGLTASFRF